MSLITRCRDTGSNNNNNHNNHKNKGPLYIWAWQTEARERQPCVTSAKKTCKEMIATRTCTASVKRIQSTLEDNTNKARKGDNESPSIILSTDVKVNLFGDKALGCFTFRRCSSQNGYVRKFIGKQYRIPAWTMNRLPCSMVAERSPFAA